MKEMLTEDVRYLPTRASLEMTSGEEGIVPGTSCCAVEVLTPQWGGGDIPFRTRNATGSTSTFSTETSGCNYWPEMRTVESHPDW